MTGWSGGDRRATARPDGDFQPPRNSRWRWNFRPRTGIGEGMEGNFQEVLATARSAARRGGILPPHGRCPGERRCFARRKGFPERAPADLLRPRRAVARLFFFFFFFFHRRSRKGALYESPQVSGCKRSLPLPRRIADDHKAFSYAIQKCVGAESRHGLEFKMITGADARHRRGLPPDRPSGAGFARCHAPRIAGAGGNAVVRFYSAKSTRRSRKRRA